MTLQFQADVDLRPYNTFGLAARAAHFCRLDDLADLPALLAHALYRQGPALWLGGGSNLLLTRDYPGLVIKVALTGIRLLREDGDHVIVEAAAGENWHDFVLHTLAQGWYGLENLSLIPGTVGASPVQNIGAYGVEVKDHLHEVVCAQLDRDGAPLVLSNADCRFGYRDSVFKHSDFGGLAGKSVITRVRFRLPRPWQPVLGYLEIERKMAETGITAPDARQIYDWICAVRRAKLPDPAVIGNAGSFFKNPVVTAEQCRDIIGRDPGIVHYPMGDGSVKLAAGWMIDACGWKGKAVGGAAVYDKQALVLVNRGDARGAEVVTLARAIQESVYGRFGIRLEPEPVVI